MASSSGRESARLLFVETCVKLQERGWTTTKHLSDVLMTSNLKHLHAHLMNTVAGPLTDPEARRMAESIRATYNTYAQALMTLPSEGPDFSIRKWVEDIDRPGEDGEQREGTVLFIAAQHVNLRSVRVLLTLWLSTAINTLMSMKGDQREIRLWFLLDEIGALHNIPAIVSGMQTARNYGGAFVMGVHTMAQLKQTYGDNLAETIASLAKTKLLMNTRDRASQDWESAQIGDGEYSEMEENWSYGVSNIRDAATLQRKIKLEPLVLPTEFAELPDLHGYLKFPQGLPAARVQLTHVPYSKGVPGFVERPIPKLGPLHKIVRPEPNYHWDDLHADEPRLLLDGDTAATAAAPAGNGNKPVRSHKTVAGTTDTGDDGDTAGAPTDTTGEGFQVAKNATGEPPERTPPKLPAKLTDKEVLELELRVARIQLQIALLPEGGGAPDTLRTIDGAADVGEVGSLTAVDEDRAAGTDVASRTRETEHDGVVIQEQRANFQAEEHAHHAHHETLTDASGVPDATAFANASELDHGR